MAVDDGGNASEPAKGLKKAIDDNQPSVPPEESDQQIKSNQDNDF